MDTLTVNFGKYRGKQIAEIWEADQQYAKWLYPQEILSGEYPEIKKFLDGKFRGSDLSFVMDSLWDLLWNSYSCISTLTIHSQERQQSNAWRE